MSDERDLDALLDPFFAAARRAAPEARPDFLSAILAQADAEQARPAPVLRCGRMRRLLSALGGWGMVGGMATAAAFGLWIGFVGSEQVLGFASFGAADAASSVLTDSDILALAGE